MRKTILTLGISMLLCTGTFAQNPAELDLTFDPGNNANGVVESMNLQPDGKIIVTGHFSSKIVRLNSDGSKDLSFSQPADWGAILKDAVILPDGKIIIVGNFTSYDGVPVNHIVRLNTNGTLDNTFNQGTGANNYLNTIALQADGKIIIGGVFTEYNGIARGGIARLNADGTIDNTFDPGTGLSGISAEAETMAIQSDGKILLAGKFTSYDGNVANLSARINADGSFDASYNIPSISGGAPAERKIATFTIQPDGKIIIGGHFETVSGVSRNGIARLNSDGTIDTSFNPGSGIQITYGTLVAVVSIMSDGKILIGGKFNTFDGANRKSIARINTSGSLDSVFDPGTGLSSSIFQPMANNFQIQPDGKILIGGDFSGYNGTQRYNVARLNGDGGTTSVENIKDEFSFSVYPNPASDIVKVDNIPHNSILTIRDINGRIMYERFVLENYESVNISGFANGVYLVQIENNGNVSTKKLIVNR